MEIRSILLIGVVLLAVGCAAQDPSKTTTTAAPTTTTTTVAPPTTTPTTKAPTTKASTTTAQPTTAKPTPAPKYPQNVATWTLEDDKDVTCIAMQGALEISVRYLDINGKNQTANVDVPKDNVTVSGDCADGVLELAWNASNHLNQLTFQFEKNDTVKLQSAAGGITPGKYALQGVTGSLYKDPALFINVTEPDVDFTFSITDKAAFQTPLNESYMCSQQEMLTGTEGNATVTLKLSSLHIEAFRSTTPGHKEFSAAVNCPADDSSDVVPIAVGAALAGLIVIVLAAYLIGRRRSRSRGYQSV